MASTDEKPVDDRDALDILESEGKEWEKASLPPDLLRRHQQARLMTNVHLLPTPQDAEIDRILVEYPVSGARYNDAHNSKLQLWG